MTCSAVKDMPVIEIMLNPDGKLFIERLGQGIDSLGQLQHWQLKSLSGASHTLFNRRG